MNTHQNRFLRPFWCIDNLFLTIPCSFFTFTKHTTIIYFQTLLKINRRILNDRMYLYDRAKIKILSLFYDENLNEISSNTNIILFLSQASLSVVTIKGGKKILMLVNFKDNEADWNNLVIRNVKKTYVNVNKENRTMGVAVGVFGRLLDAIMDVTELIRLFPGMERAEELERELKLRLGDLNGKSGNVDLELGALVLEREGEERGAEKELRMRMWNGLQKIGERELGAFISREIWPVREGSGSSEEITKNSGVYIIKKTK
eukprot:TRINITY_DN12431_c0_g1_i1.p1 TRINITY_DN12431_c0_g1~~TRINITY_DN12431_c0_g1_i1.p1  ORF type:complete len:260 (+),score=66.48 TRINITY_DN12431_c0_g1_i1:1-780(+)